jgi:hypothetical protein
MGEKKVHFGFYDKLSLVVLNGAADIKGRLTLVKPETVLSWQRTLIRRFWTFEHPPAKNQLVSIIHTQRMPQLKHRDAGIEHPVSTQWALSNVPLPAPPNVQDGPF